MIRYFTFALAATLSYSIAHAQQGNLPTPVRKLAPYPPIVCVTPNWTPEPCESRQVADEGERWEWQCGNVNVKVTLLEKSFNLPASTEYVVTGIEKSNNRFQYVWGKDDLYLNGRLCVLKAKPLPKEDETKPQPPAAEPEPPPVPMTHKSDAEAERQRKRDEKAAETWRTWWTKIEEMRWTKVEEPSRTKIEEITGWPKKAAEPIEWPNPPRSKVVLNEEIGGDFLAHLKRWEDLAETGSDVEIRRPCWSACTMIMVYVPKDRLCFGPRASLKFHLVSRKFGETRTPDIRSSHWMVAQYPPDIYLWLRDRGGVEKMSVEEFWTLDATELWAMGYRKCKE
jgi:hypothetical protein